MHRLPHLRRLALVLALLPQLLVLGSGRAVVVCVAPGGHLKVEVAASACCTGSEVSPDRAPSVSLDESDCASCSDFAIVLDPRASQSLGAGGFEVPSATALPVTATAVPIAVDLRYSAGRPLDRGHLPPHLAHLRSVLLRC